MVLSGCHVHHDHVTQRGDPGEASHAPGFACRVVGLERSGAMGQFHCLGQQGALQPLCRPFAGYEMSCWAGLAEPSWAWCNCAGTVSVACDVRGDIARLLLFSSTCYRPNDLA